MPWRFFGVRRREHRVSGSRIVIPTAVRLQIHPAKLPDFSKIADALRKSAGLFVLAYFEPIFDQGNAVIDDIPFLSRAHLEEPVILFVRTKPHYSLNAGTVIPASVENSDLARSWQMFEISLKIYL